MKNKQGDWLKETFLKGKRPFYWIVGVGFLVYFRSLFFGFTYLDDNVLILDHLFFLKDLGNIFRSFTMEVFHILHASAAYYRPMLTISFILDAQVSGESPFGYHLTNIAVHLVSASLLYLFLLRLNIQKHLSFLFALVFAVHPVLAQAVAWIPGRNDSLLALFALASLILFLNWRSKGESKYLYLHFLFFFFALFTKESALLLPLFYLGTVWVLGERLLVKNYFGPAAGWFLIVILWFMLRSIALVNPIHYEAVEIVRSLINSSPAILLYLGKLIYPANLSVLPTLVEARLIAGGASLVLILVLLSISRGKNIKYILFGTAWFFGFLLPSFIRPDSTYEPDFINHRMYLPLVGLFIVFSQISIFKKFDIGKKFHFFVAVAVLLVFSVLTQIHLNDFKDRLSFWKNAAATSPKHPLAHKNLGVMYYLDGDYELAEDHYTRSLKLNPTESMVHNNLGLIHLEREEYEQAEVEFQKEIEINPGYDNAYFNYGILFYRLEKLEEAEEMWKTTLSINPDHAGAYANLAVYYFEQGRLREAEAYYQEALKRGARF